MELDHMEHVPTVARSDCEALEEAERHYGASWKKRGGVGAFMMLARKWDRIEQQVQRQPCPWDILQHLTNDTRQEGLIDDVRDLRRYLLLVEAELLARRRGK